MTRAIKILFTLAMMTVCLPEPIVLADNLDITGTSLLRSFTPTLSGTGIKIAQIEASDTNTPPPFEINPSTTGQPTSLFTFRSALGTSSTYPNTVGTESGHADTVAGNFFGTDHGVVPQVNHVDNYDADYFYANIIASPAPQTITTRIVNQSFIFNQDSTVEQKYDNYAAKYNTIFVSGASFNATQVHPAASSFNGIGVGVSDVSNPPFGPTVDGRCKPDISAPGVVASYSTPYVAGAATVLLQAALRGDGGADSSLATNLLTIKSLLLNGAIKPAGWTNSPTSPLDMRYGAGVVNVFNSWSQLKAGKQPPIETTSVTTNTPHFPGSNAGNVASLVGWDYRAITNSTSTDKINHYYFDLPDGNQFTLTATLAWNRQQNKTGINDLNLFLYDTATSNLIASSISTVDNVEHITLPQLAPGRYDLQVVKQGSVSQVSIAETYALAFELFNLQLQTAVTNGTDLIVSWPVAPTGFNLYSATNLTPPIAWSPVTTTVAINTNTARSSVVLPIGDANKFFRLQRP